MALGNCASCAREKNLIAKGKCSTCYYRARGALKRKPTARIGFDLVMAALGQMIKEYHQAIAEAERANGRADNLKMKYIVEFHKKWTKKYKKAHAEIQAALKGVKEVPAAASDTDGPTELSFDHK